MAKTITPETDSSKWLTVNSVSASLEVRDKNYYRNYKYEVFDYCAFCRKPVANKGPKTGWIQHTTSGLLIPVGIKVPTEGEPENYQGHQSQGYFTVGPECAKKCPGYVSYIDPVAWTDPEFPAETPINLVALK